MNFEPSLLIREPKGTEVNQYAIKKTDARKLDADPLTWYVSFILGTIAPATFVIAPNVR